MAESNISDLDRRLARAEALIALLLSKPWGGSLNERDIFRLMRSFDKEDSSGIEFFYLLEDILRSGRSEKLNQIEQLASDVSMLNDRVREIQEGVESNAFAAINNRQELHSWLALQSLGVDTSLVALHRYLPLKMYLSRGTDDEIDNARRAFLAVAEVAGFEVTDELPGVRGSWLQDFFVKSRERLTSRGVQERVNKIEKAAELQGLSKPLAEVDLAYAQAIASLAKSTENVPNSVFQLGSLIFVKVTDADGPKIISRTLSSKEILEIESNPGLVQNPFELAAYLERPGMDGIVTEIVQGMKSRKGNRLDGSKPSPLSLQWHPNPNNGDSDAPSE